MKVDENLLKIAISKIPVEEELNLGEDITLIVFGNVTKKTQEDNNDGTITNVYTVKGIVAERVKE